MSRYSIPRSLFLRVRDCTLWLFPSRVVPVCQCVCLCLCLCDARAVAPARIWTYGGYPPPALTTSLPRCAITMAQRPHRARIVHWVKLLVHCGRRAELVWNVSWRPTLCLLLASHTSSGVACAPSSPPRRPPSSPPFVQLPNSDRPLVSYVEFSLLWCLHDWHASYRCTFAGI